MKIIENKTLRLSSLLHTNDSLEMRWIKSKIRKMFSELGIKLNPEKHNIMEKYYEEAFAICFSECGDLLSQWRGYADDGRGVAIGFDFNKLNTEFNNEITKKYLGISKVIYDEVKQEEMLLNKFNEILEYNIDNCKKYEEAIRILESDFAPIFKNPAFSEEKEWRLVFYFSRAFENILISDSYNIFLENHGRKLSSHKFYEKNGLISEYYDYKFKANDLIKEIIIGPKSRLFSLNDHLNDNELPHFIRFLTVNNIKCELISFKKSKASYR